MDGPECAPDQRLGLDAAAPARRFASYSDLVSMVRGRVSLGLVAAPFPTGPLRRLRLEAEVVTWLRAPRGLGVTARVGVDLLGTGLDALFLSGTVTYVGRVQPGGQLLVGAELGYGRHFASLFLGASAGMSVGVWSRDGEHPLSPSVRLLLGHAFF